MRETKFRGLNRNSNKWYYGSLLVTRQLGIHHAQIWLLDEDYPVPVDIETTGERAGPTDKNNAEIYEGDILRIDWHDNRYPPHYFEVKWDAENAGFAFEGGSPMHDASHCFEVVGNVYENTELLGHPDYL